MRHLMCSLVLGVTLALLGCSRETQQKAERALDETSEAVQSAAKDAATATEGAIEGASQAIDENRDRQDESQPD